MSKTGMISPSMMCVPIQETMDYLDAFEKNKIEYLHMDVMDGEFVPNMVLGSDYMRHIRKLTNIPFDYHFMVVRPEEKIQWFDIAENDLVSIHYESTRHITKCLQYIKSKGARPMIAINPGTPIGVLEESLELIDGVLVMTVNPGFAGQKIVESTVGKVARVREFLEKKGYGDLLIETDGNMSNENVARVVPKGADMIVAGTSSIITGDPKLAGDRIKEVRKAIAAS